MVEPDCVETELLPVVPLPVPTVEPLPMVPVPIVEPLVPLVPVPVVEPLVPLVPDVPEPVFVVVPFDEVLPEFVVCACALKAATVSNMAPIITIFFIGQTNL